MSCHVAKSRRLREHAREALSASRQALCDGTVFHACYETLFHASSELCSPRPIERPIETWRSIEIIIDFNI